MNATVYGTGNTVSAWNLEEFLRESGWSELPAWNWDGHWAMWILTEELLRIICFGDKRGGHVRGGHLRDALTEGGGKRWHKEFPPDWTPETVREAYYTLIQNEPAFERTGLKFSGTYKGIEIEIEWSFNAYVALEDRVHMYPVRGKGVRAWKNGKPCKVGQKRRK